MRHFLHAVILLLIAAFFVACNDRQSPRPSNIDELSEWVRQEYILTNESVRNEILTQIKANPEKMYADNYASGIYEQSQHTVWLTRLGISQQADSLLPWLEKADELGFSHDFFHSDTIRTLLARVRSFEYAPDDANILSGRLEFLLTQAYLRYVCGQRFGYINPRQIFNNLLVDPPAAGETRSRTVYRRLYDHGSDEVTDSFINHALMQVRQHRITPFLQEVQPTDTIYRQLHKEYLRARNEGDTARTRLAHINMERARWRYPHPTTGKYVLVNLAGQELMAVDTKRDTVLTMRVCCGNSSHKTPLLHSQIGLVELNPYWVIPQTIVRKEIAPLHVGDSAYYARNRYRAINKATGQEVNPASLTRAQLHSAQYTLRQDNGDGNSLGRIIFRFPNNFSVFLHDTNNRSAFQRSNRAISHGCVRVERPLDLAIFIHDNPTAWNIDRIRISIDLPPISAQGRQYKASHPSSKPMRNFRPNAPVPVWLDYWTLLPDIHGQLQTHPDSYGYDKVIEDILHRY